jgi:DNA-3-methyladenine glycosylase II
MDVDPGPKESTPTTPQKKRVAKVLGPPSTPTPSAVGLIAEGVGAITAMKGLSSSQKPKPKSITRLADPNTTNATLLSPETSRVVSSKDIDSLSPSKRPAVKTTTENLLEEGNKHLISVDKRMQALVDQHHCHCFSPEGLAEEIDPFESLVSGIISQQVSGAAAKAIKARFIALFYPEQENEDGVPSVGAVAARKRFPHPSQVTSLSVDTLRTAGLSQRKAE